MHTKIYPQLLGTVFRAGTDKVSTRPSARADILLKIVDGLASCLEVSEKF